ncbi:MULTISPECIES: NAD(P)H-hydrate dehydratase [unclassified Sphingomonas]|uniref:NAD(P)H-hydrate dehydratase n=1 Tax=Novosphingobium rhizosphaerae TaxID=1551649 RepID=UPI0015C964BA
MGPRHPDLAQVLTVAQMRAAEETLIGAGTDVHALMQRAGRGAGEWVRRVAAGRRVTVLCGPGNNGGDGYVIAQYLADAGVRVQVVAPHPPRTEAALRARALYAGSVKESGAGVESSVLVDCLFGSGLARPLDAPLLALLTDLAAHHPYRIAVDVPSGVDSNSGACLNAGLPDWHLTLALGAWKHAHFAMPACATMGALRLVDIGVEAVPGAARVLQRPVLAAPAANAHKYRRGLLGIVAGAMPGAALLAATAALRGGAGYVQVLAADAGLPGAPPELVVRHDALETDLADDRFAALLVGPGLGRDDAAKARLEAVLAARKPTVIDADALVLLAPKMLKGDMLRGAPMVLTPHEGEMQVLERNFGLSGHGERRIRAVALAQAAGAVVMLKGPDSVIASPAGEVTVAPRASSWLSVAGTGDVLAGAVASRLAVRRDPARAAHEALWLHGEAAHLAGPAFTSGDLAHAIGGALRQALS